MLRPAGQPRTVFPCCRRDRGGLLVRKPPRCRGSCRQASLRPEMNAVHAKISGYWLGKATGGTLGTPHEGKPGPLNPDFYDPVPTGVLPSDDLDPQFVWLHHRLESGAGEVTPSILSDAWRRHADFPYDEYSRLYWR